jgi:hypothetical protein
MRARVALIVVVALGTAGLAGEIRTGATMPLKPSSIWFEEADGLAHWQDMKKNANAAALASARQHLVAASRRAGDGGATGQ